MTKTWSNAQSDSPTNPTLKEYLALEVDSVSVLPHISCYGLSWDDWTRKSDLNNSDQLLLVKIGLRTAQKENVTKKSATTKTTKFPIGGPPTKTIDYKTELTFTALNLVTSLSQYCFITCLTANPKLAKPCNIGFWKPATQTVFIDPSNQAGHLNNISSIAINRDGSGKTPQSEVLPDHCDINITANVPTNLPRQRMLGRCATGFGRQSNGR